MHSLSHIWCDPSIFIHRLGRSGMVPETLLFCYDAASGAHDKRHQSSYPNGKAVRSLLFFLPCVPSTRLCTITIHTVQYQYSCSFVVAAPRYRTFVPFASSSCSCSFSLFVSLFLSLSLSLLTQPSSQWRCVKWRETNDGLTQRECRRPLRRKRREHT